MPRMPARTCGTLALENGRLYETGLTINHLRWLVAKGFAEHGQEMSFYGGPNARSAQQRPQLCPHDLLRPHAQRLEFATKVLNEPAAAS